jgi:tRNA pseudouridine13 synthase
MNSELPRAHGEAVLCAQIRSSPEDFVVDEVLGFAPEGEGEHLFLRVEKRGANTAWVAGELARWAGVPASAVGYAGLKDRHALTQQTFSVHLPGREAPDNLPEHVEYRVLHAARHRRKLARGALSANRFELTLRALHGERSAIEARLAQIARLGVPNWFGEQRFGKGGGNLEQARALFAGRRMRREQASILISAARSAAFNAVLAARVEADAWDRPVEGEVFMLDGARSVFGPEPLSPELIARCVDGDVHPTAAMWGAGPLRSTQRALEFDLLARSIGEDLIAGLERAGLRQERRACRLRPARLDWCWLDEGALRLRFELPAGAYATAVLHELGMTEVADSANRGKSGPVATA